MSIYGVSPSTARAEPRSVGRGAGLIDDICSVVVFIDLQPHRPAGSDETMQNMPELLGWILGPTLKLEAKA